MSRLVPVDGDPFAASSAKLIPVEGDPFLTSSGIGAAARGTERSVAPAAGGFAGFGAGFAAGGVLTAPAEAIPVAGPIINMAGALAGGLAGALGGGYLVDKAQQKLLSILPASVVKALGQDDAQRTADNAQHPYSTFLGEQAPNLIFMRPSLARTAAPAGASRLAQMFAHPGTGAVVGGAVGSGVELAKEVGNGNVDPVKLGLAAAIGAVRNAPTTLRLIARRVRGGPRRTDAVVAAA